MLTMVAARGSACLAWISILVVTRLGAGGPLGSGCPAALVGSVPFVNSANHAPEPGKNRSRGWVCGRRRAPLAYCSRLLRCFTGHSPVVGSPENLPVRGTAAVVMFGVGVRG